jgi:hypothetical protein
MPDRGRLILNTTLLLAIAAGSASAGITLIDDVTLTLDGGPDQISNGDFSSSLDHWSTWDTDSACQRRDNPNHSNSPGLSYEVTYYPQINSSSPSRTFYSTDATSIDYAFPGDNPYTWSEPTWIAASPGQNVQLGFYYKGKMETAFILGLDAGGGWSNLSVMAPEPADAWRYQGVDAVVPAGVVAVGVQFDIGNESHNLVDLTANQTALHPGDHLSVDGRLITASAQLVDARLYLRTPAGTTVPVQDWHSVTIGAGWDRSTRLVDYTVTGTEPQGNYDLVLELLDPSRGLIESLAVVPFSLLP